MQHDPELLAEVRAWLHKAATDLAAGDHNLTAEQPFTEHAVFHAQQAVEKSFKALLVWHSTPFRKTHNLEELGEQVLACVPDLRTIVDAVVPLTEYAWKFRYPGEDEAPSYKEAEQALKMARQAHDAVVARLPAGAQP